MSELCILQRMDGISLEKFVSPLHISVMHGQLVFLDKINNEHFKSSFSVGLVVKYNMRNSNCKCPNE